MEASPSRCREAHRVDDGVAADDHRLLVPGVRQARLPTKVSSTLLLAVLYFNETLIHGIVDKNQYRIGKRGFPVPLFTTSVTRREWRCIFAANRHLGFFKVTADQIFIFA
jgi:hypothetical protein